MKNKFTYGIEVNTTRLQLILDTISKHANNLKEELKQIDEAFICDCGSMKYEDELVDDIIKYTTRTCLDCNEKYAYTVEGDK